MNESREEISEKGQLFVSLNKDLGMTFSPVLLFNRAQVEAVLQRDKSFLWFVVQMFALSNLLTGHFDSRSFAQSLEPK